MEIQEKDSILKMKITHPTLFKTWRTKKQYMDGIWKSLKKCKDPSTFYGKSLEMDSKMTLAQKENVESVLECLLLVIHHHKIKNTSSVLFFPEQAQQSVNLRIPQGISFQDLAPTRCYQNVRLGVRADPEWLVIFWAKQLETWDDNLHTLTPAYPKSVLNQPFLPSEIRTVCNQLLLEWRIHGRRIGDQPPLKISSKAKALEEFRRAVPLVYDLVYTPDGFHLLECVYEMNDVLEKGSPRALPMALTVYKKFLDSVEDKRLKNHLLVNNKIGVHHAGLSEPQLRPSCLLTNFITMDYYYFPSSNIYHVEDTVLHYLDRIKSTYPTKNNFQQLDMVMGKKELVFKTITWDFFSKKEVEKMNKKFGRENYSLFFNTLEKILYCSVRSHEFKL